MSGRDIKVNSHDRRVCDRYWPHAVSLNNEDSRYYDIVEWLNTNFGSCSFKRRSMPRWCWRPSYQDAGNFSVWEGTDIFFRKDKDYTAFLLKWDNR